ncbi:methylated-DNA--[protein]-cysteine S-methyltransferase [Pseudooceanicola marinus]|uniref:methylated-DNA--[protein]-cysteine S-methyltransferase n=1 Tax=Pseudooceanicola marinus TaxID=396013 RepID=UPI001CD46F31|nr:methylated-DNA--[protein]-cysteine S-methyltransferase [Pseudooceanicola marinus]MCA1336208.1 methylated-DNA--[protein]-cysteine S-methyltransferase [Pseudooceanicola marinus]
MTQIAPLSPVQTSLPDAAPEDRYHYGLIRRAIEEIRAAETPLSLEDLAARMQMSPAHFQRVFSAWAGISPKRYQQFLALARARPLLTARASTEESAAAAGLSGTGRLHDLVLRWEAMRPGDVARGGAGVDIAWDELATPYGPALVMATGRGICGLAFTAETGRDAALADLTARWPAAQYHHDPARIRPLAEAAFEGGAARLHIMGGPFQIKVWEALLAIPEGQTSSYSDLAHSIDAPRASRAVGTAVGRNPIAWLIPCHRVLRKDGGLGGYHWGTELKEVLLTREALRQPQATD